MTPQVILHAHWVKHIQLYISIQCFTAVTCFQCFFIHPTSNILSSLSLSTLQRGGSAASLSTPAKIDSAAYHFLLFIAVTSSSASLSNTPVAYHHPVCPSCDTNCFIIQTGKIYPVLYQSQHSVLWCDSSAYSFTLWKDTLCSLLPCSAQCLDIWHAPNASLSTWCQILNSLSTSIFQYCEWLHRLLCQSWPITPRSLPSFSVSVLWYASCASSSPVKHTNTVM